MFLLNEINSRIKLASILIVIAYFVIASSKRVKVKQGAAELYRDEGTNCSEFAKFGRFNPYSVLHTKWFVFYYWAPLRRISTYVFTAPSANHTRRLKKLFEGNCVLPVQWHVRLLLMEDDRKYISLLVERSDRGEYWMYPVARVKKNQKITPRDVRLKQTGDNRLLGLLDCVDDSMIVMSRLNDVPPKGRLHEEASRLGYRGRKGKSYLYQGHEWGPIEEADEDEFWDRRTEKTISKDTSTEDKSLEGSSEEAEQLINKPEHSKAKKPKRTILAPVKPEDDEMCVKVMPELWNDPKPNPNPDNLLTKDDLNVLDSLVINDTPATEGPDGSTDNKKEIRDKKSDKLSENNKLQNQNDAHEMEILDSTDNKKESNTDKESENLPENRKLHNHKDVHKMETPDSTANKQEGNINKESENQPENDNPHNHKVCPGTTEQDEENEDCVVCFKSQVNYVSDDSYIPDSARSMPSLKDEDVPPKEVPSVEVPHFKIAGIELPLEEISRTEVPLPKVPSAKTPPSEVPAPKVPRPKSSAKVPALTESQTNSSEVIFLTPKTLDDLKR